MTEVSSGKVQGCGGPGRTTIARGHLPDNAKLSRPGGLGIPEIGGNRREVPGDDDVGIANSQMKDFYDLNFLANRFVFDKLKLCRAIWDTFARRTTRLRTEPPVDLTASLGPISKSPTSGGRSS